MAYDPSSDIDTIENGGESGTSYANESMRESDIEDAYSRLEENGYTQNLTGGWDGPSD